MRVFISWSGVASRAVAEALADWLPKVIQGVEPFVSAKDIDKGANWTVELARELDDARFGILCVAPDNLLSPWLNYEAGAIAKSVESRVCPVLLGVQKSDVRPPIAQLQMTSIDLEDFKLLMASMNKSAGNPLDLPALHEAVEIWWPKLQAVIDEIDVPAAAVTLDGVQEPVQPESTTQEMLEELLRRVRQMDQRLGRVERNGRPRAASGREAPGAPTRGAANDVFDDLYAALSRNGIRPTMFNIEPDVVTVQVNGALPSPLPGALYESIGDLAKKYETEVRVVGETRTVAFGRTGYADEPPF